MEEVSASHPGRQGQHEPIADSTRLSPRTSNATLDRHPQSPARHGTYPLINDAFVDMFFDYAGPYHQAHRHRHATSLSSDALRRSGFSQVVSHDVIVPLQSGQTC